MVDVGYKRKNSGVGRVFLFVLVVLIIAAVGVYLNKTKRAPQEPEDQVQSVATTTQILTADTTKWKRATDPKKLFTFTYPSKFFDTSAPEVNVPPEFTQKVKATRLSGEGVEIDFFVTDKNFNEVLKNLQKAYGQELAVVSVDGHQGVRFGAGAEVYYVVPVNNMNTLFISHNSVNEDIFDKILSTFKFGGAVSIEGMRYVES